MKVKELIKQLEILNPDKPVYGTMAPGESDHQRFNIDRIDLSKGHIVIILDNTRAA